MLKFVASTFLVRADCKGEVSASTSLVTKEDNSIPLPDWLTLELILLPASAPYLSFLAPQTTEKLPACLVYIVKLLISHRKIDSRSFIS